ncbi:MAG: ROK family protein [Ilumatobacteraceae bacterium]
MSELVRVGLVEETTVQSGSPGRPSLMVAPASSTNVAIAVDLAVDSLTVAAVGLGGVVLAREVVEREPGERRGDDDEVQHDVDSAVAEIERSIQRLVSSLDPASRTLGVGVGVVGLVNRHDGSVAVAPNLGWRDVALAKLLSEALSDTVDVAVANEADLAALAELRRGAAVGASEALLVWGEVGVGGGLVSRGALVRGGAGFAGEVGHLPLDPDGRRCRCGAVGCWETLVGQAALLERAGRPASAGRAGVGAVLAAAAAGEAEAMARSPSTRWLGLGLAALINVLNPAVVVLGGLFARIHPAIDEALGAEIGRRALASSLDGLRVVTSLLGPDAPLIGAAELAFDAVLSDPLAALERIIPRR